MFIEIIILSVFCLVYGELIYSTVDEMLQTNERIRRPEFMTIDGDNIPVLTDVVELPTITLDRS